MKRYFCWGLIFITSFLYAELDYVLCVDGGGSKTILQVVDQEGQLISLTKNGIESDQVKSVGSNINTVGIEGVRAVLKDLFEGLKIGEQEVSDILHRCRVIAGMAGVGLPNNRQIVASLFEEWGINKDHILVISDAELALQLVDDEGIVLISGTGSICLGKKEAKIFRVGGLGRILGDEGSGYQIGFQALKMALAEEYGWGSPTNLTPVLREFFHLSDLKSLIPQVNLGELSPSKIASIAPLVFKKAWEGDVIAERIIEIAARELNYLLCKMLEISCLSDCDVHLWGGVFSGTYSDLFINKMIEQIPGKLHIVNQSHENAAVLFARKFFSLDRRKK